MTLDHLDAQTQKIRDQQYMSVEVNPFDKDEKITLPDLNTLAPIKLIALDLDGTTLREDKTFSPMLIDTIHKAQDMGVTVAICTGRAPESVFEFARILGLDKGHGYCVCFNGGALINLEDITKDLSVNCLNAQDLIDVEALACQEGCAVHAYSDRRVLLTQSNIVFTEMEIAASMQPFEKILFPHEVNPNEQVYKIIAVGDEYKLDSMRAHCPQEFNERFNIARTHANFLEFMNKDCSKGATLNSLCKLLGITLENVVAFGDAENDIEMIASVGVGVAVANAMPRLKAVAKYQTYNYLDDGVAIYLQKLLRM